VSEQFACSRHFFCSPNKILSLKFSQSLFEPANDNIFPTCPPLASPLWALLAVTRPAESQKSLTPFSPFGELGSECACVCVCNPSPTPLTPDDDKPSRGKKKALSLLTPRAQVPSSSQCLLLLFLLSSPLLAHSHPLGVLWVRGEEEEQEAAGKVHDPRARACVEDASPRGIRVAEAEGIPFYAGWKRKEGEAMPAER